MGPGIPPRVADGAKGDQDSKRAFGKLDEGTSSFIVRVLSPEYRAAH